MRKVLLLAFFAYCGYWLFGGDTPIFDVHETPKPPEHELIMYSLTTCGNCIKKAKELRANGIEFTEYYIVRDYFRNQELGRNLKRAGFNEEAVGTPTFDVGGTILLNNPSLSRIMEVMEVNRKHS